MCDSGIASLVVDKTVSEVTEVADRVVIIVKGKVAFDGTPVQLMTDPAIMQQYLGVQAWINDSANAFQPSGGKS